MTLERARKILWPDYDVLSDEQIQEIIDLFRALAITLIEKEVWNI